jgi:hypothetical protein
MKVSGFAFIKNAEMLGYPFIESIQSILPILDEFRQNSGYKITSHRIRLWLDEKLGIDISKKQYTEAKI